MDTTELLRSLAKEAAQLKNPEPDDNQDEKKQNSAKPSSEFALTLAEYPDFIITRTTPRITRHLVVMPSAGAAFIKTEAKGKEPVSEQLTENNYAAFSQQMPDITLPEDFWTKVVSRGKVFGGKLCDLINDNTLLGIIRKRITPPTVDVLDMQGHCAKTAWQEAYELYPNLMVEYRDNERILCLLRNEIELCKDMLQRFDIQNMREFLNEYTVSLVNFIPNVRPNWYYDRRYQQYARRTYQRKTFETDFLEKRSNARNPLVLNRKDRDRQDNDSMLPIMEMKFETVKNYILYSATRMGFALSMSEFFQTWIDTLEMQYLIYGDIKEKYPEDLPLLHCQLSYKTACMQAEIDQRKFERQSQKACAYEGTFKDFVFVAPKIPQDIYDEAIAQANCLAGYVKPFTEGDCLLLFMRKKESPEQSFITVEIVNGEVVQAKRALNKGLAFRETDILNEWVSKCNQKMCAA